MRWWSLLIHVNAMCYTGWGFNDEEGIWIDHCLYWCFDLLIRPYNYWICQKYLRKCLRRMGCQNMFSCWLYSWIQNLSRDVWIFLRKVSRWDQSNIRNWTIPNICQRWNGIKTYWISCIRYWWTWRRYNASEDCYHYICIQ